VNRANVVQLSLLLDEWADSKGMHDFWGKLGVLEFAEFLAARGVLVPAALTDASAHTAWLAGAMESYAQDLTGDEFMAGYEWRGDPSALRDTLARIARGE